MCSQGPKGDARVLNHQKMKCTTFTTFELKMIRLVNYLCYSISTARVRKSDPNASVLKELLFSTVLLKIFAALN